MNKLLKLLGSSVFSPHFLADTRDRPFWPAVLLCAILGAFTFSIGAATVYSGAVALTYMRFPEAVEAAFPDDLELTLAGDKLSVNKPVPYYIPNTLIPTSTGETIEYLAIIDTNDELSESPIDNSTMLLAKSDHFVTGSASQQRVNSFDKHEGTSTLDKSEVSKIVGVAKPVVKPLVIIGGLFLVVIGVCAATMFWVLFHLLYLLFPAVLIFLYALAKKPRFTFAQSYMLALYAAIPVVVLSYVVGLVSVPLPEYMYTLLVLLIAVVNIAKAQHAEVRAADPYPVYLMELKRRVHLPAVVVACVFDTLASLVLGVIGIKYAINAYGLTQNGWQLLDAFTNLQKTHLGLTILTYLLGALVTMLAAYIAARWAKHDPMLNAGLVAVPCVAVGLMLANAPLAYLDSPLLLVLGIVLGPVFALLGGYIYVKTGDK